MATVSEICSSSTTMASQDQENNINTLDDSSLLMTLLEESSQVEDGDDERLRIVIQSLEAEITDQESSLENDVNSDDPTEDDIQKMDVYISCSISPDHLDFEWKDEEMDCYYYYCHDDYMAGGFGDNMENMNDFVGVRDYSLISYGGIGMVEEEDYGGLWQ